MRMTIRISDRVFREIKALAAETGRSLSRVIEDALIQALVRRGSPRGKAPVRLTTCKGKGLQAAIDLDDTAGLLDRMEAE